MLGADVIMKELKIFGDANIGCCHSFNV